jgi:two-component system, sensor histidine kinase PdtaS
MQLTSSYYYFSFKKIWKLILFYLLTTATGYSQSPVADSFLHIANTSLIDTARIDAYRNAAIELIETNPDKAINYCLISYQKATEKKDRYREALAIKVKGVAYDIKGNLDSCLICLNEANIIFKELEKKDWQSHALSDIAIAYFYRGNYELALRNNLAALTMRREIGDKSFISKSLNNIGIVYRARKDYKNSISSYQQSLAIKKELKDEQGILNTVINIGALYQNDGKYDSALLYSKEALLMAEKLKSIEDISAAKGNIGAALHNLNRSDEALVYLKDSERINTENNFSNYFFTVYEAMGEVYMNRKEYRVAQQYFQRGLVLAKNKQRKESEKVFNMKLALLYSAMGNYQLAFKKQLEGDSIDNKLLNEENIRQLNEMTQVYQTVEKEKEIIALNIQGEANKKVILARKRERNYFIAAAAIFLGMTFFAWKALIINKRKKEKLDEQNKIIERALSDNEILMKEIHHRVKNNMQIVSSLLDLQSISIKDPLISDAVKEGKNRVQSMALIHQNLYGEDNLKGIKAKQYINNLLKNLCDSYNISNEKVKIHSNIEDLNLDVDTMIPIGLILNELLTNAFKYAFNEKTPGVLEIDLREENKQLQLSVKDNGPGFPLELDAKTTKSFGLRMIRAFAQKLKAVVEIKNDNGASVQLSIKKYLLA